MNAQEIIDRNGRRFVHPDGRRFVQRAAFLTPSVVLEDLATGDQFTTGCEGWFFNELKPDAETVQDSSSG